MYIVVKLYMYLYPKDCEKINNCVTFMRGNRKRVIEPECQPTDEDGIVDFDKKYSLEIDGSSLPSGVCRVEPYIAIIYVWNTDSK